MALLVFMSILTIITQQYVPIMMEDKEASHMDTVEGQFAQLKSGIDSLVLNQYTGYPRYSPVKLGSEGVPLFGGQTAGIARLNTSWVGRDKGMNLSFDHPSYRETLNFWGGGKFYLHVYNRYYEQQRYVYENGAILLSQSDDQVMKADPPIFIEKVGPNYTMKITMVEILGEKTSIGGTGTVGVTSELLSTSRKTFEDPGNLTLDLTSEYGTAWYNWLLNETDLRKKDISKNSENKVEIEPQNDIEVSSLQLTHAKIEMTLED